MYRNTWTNCKTTGWPTIQGIPLDSWEERPTRRNTWANHKTKGWPTTQRIPLGGCNEYKPNASKRVGQPEQGAGPPSRESLWMAGGCEINGNKSGQCVETHGPTAKQWAGPPPRESPWVAGNEYKPDASKHADLPEQWAGPPSENPSRRPGNYKQKRKATLKK